MSFGSYGRGHFINENGWVACHGDYAPDATTKKTERIFVYNINTAARIVDELSMGSSKIRVTGISNDNVVVGYGKDVTGAYFGFVWDEVNGIRKINDLMAPTLGLDALYGYGISDDGKLLILNRSDNLLYVLVPEPATLGLLAVGACTVLARRRRK